MLKLNKEGFTLIELLVVIAIIGILASIVLVSLNDARNKGYDTEMKSELSQIRNHMEMCYDENSGTYSGCTVPANTIPPACSDDASYTLTVSTSGNAYAVYSDLCGADYDWCIDSTGQSKNTTEAVGAAATACP
ncbi:MAG: type II secretion system protein [Candidatus Pacebacteria bacterium]|nr:type II secretion system protein [Candidatus Paceibacterota bacterium]